MFALPSLWNLIVSTLVFSIIAKYSHIHLDKRGIAKTAKRNLWVLVVASLLSWGAGEAADWADERVEGKPTMQSSDAAVAKLTQAVEQIPK